MNKSLLLITALAVTTQLPSSAFANENAFDECPAKAFLVQTTNAKLYGIDLVSGLDTVITEKFFVVGETEDDISDNTQSINALGFNFKDNYLYGYSKEVQGIVQIDKNYKMRKLTISDIANTNFYVGDVYITGSEGNRSASYLAYHPDHGLYKVPLGDNLLTETIQAEKVSGSENWNLNIFDFAFHPSSNRLYAMESNGNLWEIDASANPMTRTFITQLEFLPLQSGAFGAAYFDVDGILYVSNNKSGNLYKVDLSNSPVDLNGILPTAEKFNDGPNSSQNDGARCAIAKVEVQDSSIDFGDAPIGYGTSLENNGARHLFDPEQSGANLLYLGSSVDGENLNYDADIPSGYQDASDDGVFFVTDFAANELTQIIATASTSGGFLYAWFDWNGDGLFSQEEMMIEKQSLSAGDNSVLFTVPETAQDGSTWARFRLTNGDEDSFTAYGGAVGGEVEDYEITTFGSGTYPSENDWVTLAFEDKWPFEGDYDFNDLVLNYRTTVYEDNGAVVSYKIEGEIVGVGATFHNGFAVRLHQRQGGTVKSIAANNVDTENVSLTINGVAQTGPILEEGRSEAIAVIMSDVWDFITNQAGCNYFRTEVNCDVNSKVSFTLTIPLLSPVSDSLAPKNLLNPFIFAAKDHYHGSFMEGIEARGWEVHIKNQSPTEAFNSALWSVSADDASNPAGQLFFQTSAGQPFAIEIGSAWRHPKEQIEVTDAYIQFADFASSGGTSSKTWYNTYKSNLIIERGAQ